MFWVARSRAFSTAPAPFAPSRPAPTLNRTLLPGTAPFAPQEADDVRAVLAAMERTSDDAERLRLRGNMTVARLAYSSAKYKRMFSGPEFRRLLPRFADAFNVAVLFVILRATLPRLLTMQSLGDLGEVAEFLGLPGRDELVEYVNMAGEYNFWVKLAAFQGIILVEKVRARACPCPKASVA